MTRDGLEGAELRDCYTEALEEVIAAKRDHQVPREVPELEIKPGRMVLDLMAALEESVSQAQSSRGEASQADVHELHKQSAKKGGRETTTTKATAKKTASKKTAVNRPAARKPGRSA
ncbi:hypothetical protein ACFC00_38695 [Streptomyces adustus]|uniref:hypothetical protein n=1 Tax=Streptomyces adustus TaxID=1609272 RepID=UPI0035D86BFD